jgi:hypothetical protein
MVPAGVLGLIAMAVPLGLALRNDPALRGAGTATPRQALSPQG